MKHRTKNPDIVKLNIITAIVLILCTLLAYCIWNGYIRFLDSAFAMRREGMGDMMINVGIIVAMAGLFEIIVWKVIKSLIR